MSFRDGNEALSKILKIEPSKNRISNSKSEKLSTFWGVFVSIYLSEKILFKFSGSVHKKRLGLGQVSQWV